MRVGSAVSVVSQPKFNQFRLSVALLALRSRCWAAAGTYAESFPKPTQSLQPVAGLLFAIDKRVRDAQQSTGHDHRPDLDRVKFYGLAAIG